MVFGIKREWADDVLAIFIAILFFQSLPRISFIGAYFDKYPEIVMALAFVILIYRKKILNVVSS